MISKQETIPASSSIVGSPDKGIPESLIIPVPLSGIGVHNSGAKVVSNPLVIPGVLPKTVYIWTNPATRERERFESLNDKIKAHIKLILNANNLNFDVDRTADVLAPLINHISVCDSLTMYECNGKLFETSQKAEAFRTLSV